MGFRGMSRDGEATCFALATGTVGCPSTLGTGRYCLKAVDVGADGGPSWGTGVSPCMGEDEQPPASSESPGKGPKGPPVWVHLLGQVGTAPTASVGNDVCLGEASSNKSYLMPCRTGEDFFGG